MSLCIIFNKIIIFTQIKRNQRYKYISENILKEKKNQSHISNKIILSLKLSSIIIIIFD